MAKESVARGFLSEPFTLPTVKARVLAISLAIIWLIAYLLPQDRASVQSQLSSTLMSHLPDIPSVKIDFHPNRDPRTAYNSSKLALLIESRPIPHLVPQLLHMISVVPPDWRFLFLGSNRSVVSVGRSIATQHHVASRKLDLAVVPPPWGEVQTKKHHDGTVTVKAGLGLDKEGVYRMMTDMRFYDNVIPGVEWLLKFEADSIMCANSNDSLNDWLHYDWAGAARTSNDRFAGNGGLSYRRVSAIRKVLAFQKRYNDTGPEDEWFGQRMTLMPGLKIASAEEEMHFSVEDIWADHPMGYHVREGGTNLPEDIWADEGNRRKIFGYCPELSMIMPMKLERQRCRPEIMMPDVNGEVYAWTRQRTPFLSTLPGTVNTKYGF